MSTFQIKFSGRELVSHSVQDLSGGIDVKTSTRKQAVRKNNKFLTTAKNVVLDNDGCVSRRPAFDTVNTHATLTGTSASIMGGYHFRRSAAAGQVLVAFNSNIYNCGADGTSAPSSVKSGLTAGKVTSFATYNDICIICNGVDAPMQYDGTTVTALAGSSPATLRQVVVHGNRVFGLATAAPSRLYWSKLNNPTDWAGTDDAGFMDVSPNDGSTISQIIASNQELVIIKGNRPYRLQGIGPTTGYTVADHLVPMTGSVGSPYERGACFAFNDVWYVSQVGFHKLSSTSQFGDLAESFPSEPIEPLFIGGTAAGILPGAIDWAPTEAISNPQTIYDPGTQAIYIGVVAGTPATADGQNVLLVFDPYTKGWTFWTPPAEFTAMWSFTDSDNRKRVMFGAYGDVAGSPSGASILMLNPTDTGSDASDAGTVTIPATVGHASDLGAPDVVKSPRYLTMFFGAAITGSIDLSILYDSFGQSPTSLSKTITLSSTRSARVDLSGICTEMEVQIVAETSHFKWAGYRVDWRERRRIRQA